MAIIKFFQQTFKMLMMNGPRAPSNYDNVIIDKRAARTGTQCVDPHKVHTTACRASDKERDYIIILRPKES